MAFWVSAPTLSNDVRQAGLLLWPSFLCAWIPSVADARARSSPCFTHWHLKFLGDDAVAVGEVGVAPTFRERTRNALQILRKCQQCVSKERGRPTKFLSSSGDARSRQPNNLRDLGQFFYTHRL